MTASRILVTGAAGLLGRHVVDELLSRNATVVGLDRRRGAHDIPWHVGDVTDAALLARAVEGCAGVVHLAAIPNIWSGDAETIMRVNVVGTYLALKAAEEAGVRRVVLCSSDSVVGFTVAEGMMRPPLYLPVDLAHPLRATDPYGMSKVLNEETGRSFAERGRLEVLALRPVFVAYEEMYPEIAMRAADPARYRGPMAGGPSSAGGGPCWHHVDPRDLARAFALALKTQWRGFESVFVSAAVTLSPEPTLARLERVLGYLPEVRDPALYEREPFHPLYDLSATRERLGFVPRFDARPVAAARTVG